MLGSLPLCPCICGCVEMTKCGKSIQPVGNKNICRTNCPLCLHNYQAFGKNIFAIALRLCSLGLKIKDPMEKSKKPHWFSAYLLARLTIPLLAKLNLILKYFD